MHNLDKLLCGRGGGKAGAPCVAGGRKNCATSSERLSKCNMGVSLDPVSPPLQCDLTQPLTVCTTVCVQEMSCSAMWGVQVWKSKCQSLEGMSMKHAIVEREKSHKTIPQTVLRHTRLRSERVQPVHDMLPLGQEGTRMGCEGHRIVELYLEHFTSFM